jgi:hypothetical protein
VLQSSNFQDGRIVFFVGSVVALQFRIPSVRAMESSGAFQPLEKDVILDVVFAAFHSHQNFATRQSANGLLHDADARITFAQSFADLTAHCRRFRAAL